MGVEEIITLLKSENTDNFEIAVPKSSQEFFSERESIARDHLYLAYAGQLFSEIAETFSYDHITPDVHQSVVFYIKPGNIEELAEVILNISYGCENGDEDDQWNFSEDLNCFEDDLQTTKLACPEFIEYFNEFSDEEE